MLFWLLAIAITAIACAALYYAAAGRGVNAPPTGPEPAVEAHYRRLLSEIGTDVSEGRMPATEGEAARRELAREYVRQQAERPGAGRDYSRILLPASLAAVVVIAFATYAVLGRPGLPSQPLASRPEALAQTMNLEDAIARVERRLASNPDDLRGWTVIAPAYVELGRYGDAERAYRRILTLAPPTADAETDLAEMLLAQSKGGSEEAMVLLRSAAARDAKHVRSRFYLAGEATRVGDFDEARQQWQAVLALAQGEEAWVPIAKQGLAVAEAGLEGPAEDPAIRTMVEGLSARLLSEGGSIEEWTQLVRSRLVLGERDAAKAAYGAAVEAYPDPGTRSTLDALAHEEGLMTMRGGSS